MAIIGQWFVRFFIRVTPHYIHLLLCYALSIWKQTEAKAKTRNKCEEEEKEEERKKKKKEELQ